ncbi:MAG: F0F1 ATP synthase subunit alpha, partial [Calditrichaeota bacterium]
GNLRLSYSQFEELESFARFSSRLDEETRMKLMRGRRVREILKQPQYEPIPVPEQIAVLLSVTEGILDDFEPEEMTDLTGQIRSTMRKQLPDISRDIEDGKKLDDESREKIVNTLREVLDLDEKQ